MAACNARRARRNRGTRVAPNRAPAARDPAGRGGGGELVHNVDPAQVLVEFETVEQHDVFIEQHHVGKMRVAVTFADETLPLAPGQRLRERAVAARGPGLQALEPFEIVGTADAAADLLEVLAPRGA